MSWQEPHIPAESSVVSVHQAEYSASCVRPATSGSEKGPRRMLSAASVSGLLCVPSTLSTEWQKKQVTPMELARGTVSRLRPSVVAPSCRAMGAWHFTQKLPNPPSVSRWPRWFIATKTGSLEA